MVDQAPRINGERLLRDLHDLRKFGARGTGVVRRSLTAVDVESRHWLVERMKDAGLDASIDGIGNVFGLSKKSGKALLVGSHTDTQPEGGWLDGTLGVMYGLEIARAFAENDSTQEFAVDVASWIDEEGTFSLGSLGSEYFCGLLADDALESAENEAGQSLLDALKEAGFDKTPRARLDSQRYAGYIEGHIEQGPYLEDEGKSIGVVTSIAGMRNLAFTFEGEQNHAGTAPMDRRKDACRKLIELAGRINHVLSDHVVPTTVWTIGQIELIPGSPNIVPGAAKMTLQIRDGEESRVEKLTSLVVNLAADLDDPEGVRIAVDPKADRMIGTVMDDGLRAHIERAAEHHVPGCWRLMPSAAGHDAQALATQIPSAMLFIPSIGGISHAFEEDTKEKDIVLGCQVLATAAASILRERR
jgi:N-carbamoyl-L-amino-acid hydrolase